jgi:hypothetical protein
MTDANLTLEITEAGYAVVNADPHRLEHNLKAVMPLVRDLNLNEGLNYSLLGLQGRAAEEADILISGFFARELSEFLPDYRFLCGSFLVKRKNTHPELGLHQDWNYVDESAHLPVTCWMPLTDTGLSTGGMFLLPGSHRWTAGLRSNSYPTARIPSQSIGDNPGLRHLHVKSGQILLFHPGIWHGSSPNPYENDRTVLTCIGVPRAAQLLYYHKLSETRARVFRMPGEAYRGNLPELVTDTIPKSFHWLRDIDYTHSDNMPDLSLDVPNDLEDGC